MTGRRWTVDDLSIVNPIDHIRRNPRMYLGTDSADGALLAERLAADLIFLNALPVSIDRGAGWWIVAAGEDWLAGETDISRAFAISRPFPERDANDMHAEILLTAFAAAVATCTSSGWKWILAPEPAPDFPAITPSSAGRIVAFRLRE